uniref:Replication protein A 70 kDa DNA-binding subunit B/D first OB fold domain-containing protein n=1 Tax=Brassica oleracea var. oleracea TaxID=109376 RepID=A0A0D3BZU2_BRAOL
MTHYNKLSEVSYNPKITSWRFRVKIHMIYHFYSYVTNSGPFYKYVLSDEEGTKMEMTIYGNSDRFRGLEKQEGKWVEIFRVEVNRSYPGFQATNSRFNLSATRNTQVHIIDPLNNRLFMDFKNIHAIPHMGHMDRNYPIDIMGVVFNTEAHFDDPASPRMVFYIRNNMFNPRLPEVEEFWQSLLSSDPYVQRYGALLYLIGESFVNPFEGVIVVFKLQRIKRTIKTRTNELGDAHSAPTLTRYSQSSYSSPTTGRGR